MSKERKRRLEPLGTYDPYRPRIFGVAGEIEACRRNREIVDIVVTNEAFAARKQREIAEKARAIAEGDAEAIVRAGIEAWCKAAPKSKP